MKLTVTDNFLAVRDGAPHLNAPANVYLAPGDVVEVEETLYKGDSYDGIDNWYKGLGTSNYYWSGGGSSDVEAGTIFYNSFLKQFDQTILQTQGDGTTVMVIDEGMAINPEFFNTANVSANNIEPGPLFSDHGNFIGGILAGKKDVIGLIPKAKIISVKFNSDTSGPAQFLKNLVTALGDVLAHPGPIVVNLSQGFNKYTMEGRDEEKSDIIDLMQKIANQPNKVVICSAGDNNSLSRQYFPAFGSNCISVGCIDAGNTEVVIPSTLNILSPQVYYTSFSIDFKLKELVGSSFATAIVTALCSCIIAGRLPGNTNKADLLNELRRFAVDRSAFKSGNLSTFQYQLI